MIMGEITRITIPEGEVAAIIIDGVTVWEAEE